MKKSILIFTLITFIIFISSCDLLDSGDTQNIPGSIVGKWKEDNAVITLLLTTNSNQTAINFLNSTGELAVTGSYQTKLPLLIETPEDEEEEITSMLVAINPTAVLNDTIYLLGLDPNGADSESVFQISVNDGSEYEDVLTGNVTFNYNGLTLSVTNANLTSDDTQMSVNISGSITYPQVSINANQPTQLSLNASQFYNFGNTETIFFEDSTFLSSEDQGLSDSTGAWEVVGDTLKLTTTTEVEDFTTGEIVHVDTTVSLGYVNSGNSFTVSQSIDVCETAMQNDEEMTCDEVYATFGQFFKMDEGSITNAEILFQLIFERIPEGQLAKNNRKKHYKNWREYIPEQFK